MRSHCYQARLDFSATCKVLRNIPLSFWDWSIKVTELLSLTHRPIKSVPPMLHKSQRIKKKKHPDFAALFNMFRIHYKF